MDDDLGPLPVQHPRSLAMQYAEQEFRAWWTEFCVRHKLTGAERTLLLAEMLSNFAARMVSIERRADA